MTEVNEAVVITNCAFNVLSSYTAITLNIITILALRRTSSLPGPLKTMLLSLAISDLGVGLFVQPLYVASFVTMSEGKPARNIINAYGMTSAFLCVASFFGVMALSADRFLAIHFHLRYQVFVTQKRVVIAVVSIWVFSAVVSQIAFQIKSVTYRIIGTISMVCLISSACFYYKIYATVQRHANQIQILQLQPLQRGNETMEYSARLKKAAVGTFYVYLVFLICNLPNTCLSLIPPGLLSDFETFLPFSDTMVFLNSSLNPLIYCWKMRHIRQAIMDMLRKVYLGSHN